MAGDVDTIIICGGAESGFGLLYANAPFGASAEPATDEAAGRGLLDLLSGLPDDQRAGLKAALALSQPAFLHLDLAATTGLQGRTEVAACPAPPDAAAPAIWVIRLREQGLRSGPPPIDLGFADQLPLGLVLFDAEDRLTWFNGTYQRVLGPNAHLLRIGERFEDIMSAAYRSGHAAVGPGDLDQRIAERTAHHRNHDSFEEALSGGRWLLTQEIATADGGTLGVRTDITEIKRAGGTIV